MKTNLFFLMSTLTLALAACSDGGGSTGSAGTGGAGGSGGAGGGSALTQFPAVSECGGFVKSGSPGAKIDPPAADPATYCDAERLLWAYDAASQSLGLSNTRVLLNCCGDHSITVVEEDGTYVINEKDAPEAAAGGARCNCMCVFDYTISVETIPSGIIPIRLVLDVTDSMMPPKVVYEGSLDLSKGSGEIVIDPNTVEPWCMP
ncbi:MAG: hypothetical protein HUU21_06955 [Polyangiaceae bacterium]|nr:hypothetical protein [Polyangiaceae bacterium]NUQ73276.1 hypothetical protein [Polyangiaceae bacterium]